jgi:hypothetical protein
MNLLPKIKFCPSCRAVNLIKINGITYNNDFQSLTSWTLKKNFSCRKCKVNLGLFINNLNIKEEKLIWIDFFRCQDIYLNKLNKLHKNKIKYKEKDKKKEYQNTIKEIEFIQNQIRIDQSKVKIKAIIENKRLLI